MTSYLVIEPSGPLNGSVALAGAKNAVLVIMASLILTKGKSVLSNVPASDDVFQMMRVLQSLGAHLFFDQAEHMLHVDASTIDQHRVSPDLMKKMRASVLVMGPLLARFGKAEIALPGGCVIGARPIDYHLKGFKKMGVTIELHDELLTAHVQQLHPARIVLEYPSVGATENIIMAAALTRGTTTLVNAALEPEVLDLIDVLNKMGARVTINPPATLSIEGVDQLSCIEHEIVGDRLEAGSLLLAAAATGGVISLPDAPALAMDVFLLKLEEMGHAIEVGSRGIGITLRATQEPKAVSFKTAPYPGFPTDLQAPMMALQCLAQGMCFVEETVHDNRFLHVRELQKMGAVITAKGHQATVTGIDKLYGTHVIATDIRASCALVVAGLAAQGKTIMSGLHHWRRGYEKLEDKLNQLGARLSIVHDAIEPLAGVTQTEPVIQVNT